MFINFTNHPSQLWDEKQRQAALQYGEIYDMPFPHVEPTLETKNIENIADQCVKEMMKLKPKAILVQGEMTLNYHVVKLLKENNIKVVCACSKRQAHERKDEAGRVFKESVFQFIKFREY